MNLQVFPIPSDSILPALRDSYFEIQALVERLEIGDRDRKLLGQVMLLIRDRKPVTSWDPQVCSDFIMLVCRGIEHSALAGNPAEVDYSQLANLTCSLITATEEPHPDACIYAGQVWILSKMTANGHGDPQELLNSSLRVLEPLYVASPTSSSSLEDSLKAQIVLYIARQADRAGSFAHFNVIRDWCQELLLNEIWSSRLLSAGAATPFGLAAPSASTAVTTPEGGSEFWGKPSAPLDGEEEWKSALFELRALSFIEPCPLSPRTREQVNALRPQTDKANLSKAFFFSVGDLWQCFVRTGSRDALKAAQKLAALVLHHEYEQGGDDGDRYFSNAVTMWMRLQLPILVKTCEASRIIPDSHRLCENLGWRQRDQVIRQAILEAFVGECRALEAEGDSNSRETFAGDSFEDLKRVHDAYLEKCRATGKLPSSEEALAWDYLSTNFGQRGRDGAIKDEDGSTSSLVSTVSGTILDNPTFVHVIRKGAHQAAYDLVNDRCEEIRELLMRRLDVKLLPEHLMSPEGRVYSPNASARGQVDGVFLEAEQAIAQGFFSRAYELLERLANRLQGRPREFCRSWQAYALARNGDLLLARQCLQDLIASRFPYPSAYWNLACCLPPEQMERQLDVLGMGIEIAPHPRILHGAVFLASVMNDARVAGWLLYLTFPEALLLAFQVRFDDISPEDRDKSLLRLNHYLKHGEPIIPDPTDPKINYQVAVNYLNDLIQREQIKAAEFWLRCREPIAQRHFEFWQLKTALLHQTGRRLEAARAFQKELQCRLEALGKGRFIRANSPADVTQRSNEWLRHCMAPELQDIGRDIYALLVDFAERQGRNVLPRDRRLLEFYDRRRGIDPNRPINVKMPSPPVIQPPPIRSREALLTSIAAAGAECSRELHEVEHLPRVELTLRKLSAELESQGLSSSLEALQHLFVSWREYEKQTTKEQRQESYRAARLHLAEFESYLRKELTQEEGVTAQLLLQAFKRVNERLARSLNLLPEISVEGPDGNLAIPADGKCRSFAARISSNQEADSVRLVACAATILGGLVDLPLRDRLQEIETRIAPSQPALVSFSVPDNVVIETPCDVQILVSYDYAGETFSAPPVTLQLVAAQGPVRSYGIRSPYIFGRALELDEIEKHFFGREKEKEMLMASVSNGQQRLYYVEGIRRSGKTSLLRSVHCEIVKQGLPLVPVYASAAAVSKKDSAGKVLYNLARQIVTSAKLSDVGVEVPAEERFTANLADAYSQFVEELSRRADQRVVVFLDDFQALVEQASAAAATGEALADGVSILFNLIRHHAGPNSKLLWVFAGHRAQRQFRNLLPGVLLWADLRPLRIDFLSVDAVAELIREPLRGVGIALPDETLARVQLHTAGHPEVSQHIGELMFLRATEEKRSLITPADADDAAREIATGDSFADTWYPLAELTDEQRSLIGAFVNAVKPGGSIVPSRLVAGQQLTESLRHSLDDLVARKVLEYRGGEIKVKALVLDLWLHRTVPTMITEAVNGSVAVFVDVANLTSGNGSTVLGNLDTMSGEHGIPGQFDLETVLDVIEREARRLSPAPIAAKWVINYPRRCPAVVVCSSKGFYIENIPEELKAKGSDDIILAAKMWEVEDQYPTVNHFLLVLGDKDYKEAAIDRLLKNGKYVHLVSRKSALARRYEFLANTYPQRFSVATLEDLLCT